MCGGRKKPTTSLQGGETMHNDHPDTDRNAQWALFAAIAVLGLIVLGSTFTESQDVQHAPQMEVWAQPGTDVRDAPEPHDATWYATGQASTSHLRSTKAANAWVACDDATFADRVRTYLSDGLFSNALAGARGGHCLTSSN